MKSIIEPSLSDIVEVKIETDLLISDCLRINNILKHGSIDYGNKGKIIYIDCSQSKDCKSNCVYMPALLNYIYTEGAGFIKFKRGQKGQVLDDILDEFDKSDLGEIEIPIKVSKSEERSYPENIKRDFLVLEEYTTKLDADTIRRISNKEFVEKYILTIRKRGTLKKKSLKDTIIGTAKKAGKSFVDMFKSD